MKDIKIMALTFMLCFLSFCHAAAQECKTLPSLTSGALVSYLDGIVPSDENAPCITFAIKSLSVQRYEPAISVLAKLLDFRRPPNAHEKARVVLHPPSIDEMYPAAAALEEMGKKSLPAVLEVIKSVSASATSRNNAVTVWMEIYKHEAPQGIALLKREASGIDDTIVKQNLDWALSKAQTLCYGQDRARCKAAAGQIEP